MYEVRIRRSFSQNRDQDGGVDFIADRATGGNRGRWTCNNIHKHPVETGPDGYIYTYTLTFEKTSGRRSDDDLLRREWFRIIQQVEQSGKNARFGQYPWEVIEASMLEGRSLPSGVGNNIQTNPENQVEGVRTESQSGTRHATDQEYQTLEEVAEAVGPEIRSLLADDDYLTDTFSEIYGRNPQIRTLLSSVLSFFESNGQRRNHALLYGLPACAKTQILRTVTDLLGPQAVLSLDATSTTSAGIYKTFFEQLDVVPPIVKIEEMEKTDEAALRVWLGALDDRGELRKVNYREQKVREVRILCLATANDKTLFDRLMGGTEAKPGALSSRFVHQLKCPRPDRDILYKILDRDVRKFGGRHEWIWPAILLAEAIETDDPRKVLAFLDGGNRLISGEYQHDILRIVELEDKFEDLMRRTEEAIAGDAGMCNSDACEIAA